MYQTKLNYVAASRSETRFPVPPTVVEVVDPSRLLEDRTETDRGRGADTHALLIVSQRIMSPRHTIR